MNSRLDEMYTELANAPEEVLPSKFWVEMNNRTIRHLDEDGYENFKRTITRNYFNWVGGVLRPQVQSQYTYLRQHLPITTLLGVTFRTLFMGSKQGLSWKHVLGYKLLTRLVWAYGLQINSTYRLNSLEEPTEGNPFRIYYGDKLISQDLANSFLEFQAVMDSGINRDNIKTVMELGAGYGRTSYAFLKLKPNIRYIIADIPPALYVAEKYLSSQFADRRIFKFRPFTKYEEIAQEFEQAQIAFLLPHQIEMIPDKSIDLALNISSLHEMVPSQINYYLRQIDRLTNGHFYMKQWKTWYNPLDEVQVNEEYSLPKHWSRVFWRECRVQTMFFEALLKI